MSDCAFSSQEDHPKEQILLLVRMQVLFPFFSFSQFEGIVSVEPSDGNRDFIRR
jgi:hypothetical protein